ncbi:hypothetical protein R5R35_007167 [Gryllus longicercus]|uniref:C-type lectin domain-containing protein n=1 Tax=Gryllus longicercus TaxID=2509291 RepID=A0AAN9VA28_9ORTH
MTLRRVVAAAVALAALAAGAARAQQVTREWCERVCQCSAFDPVRRRLPQGYVTAPGVGSYKVYTDPLPWKQANETCARDGGFLAVPDDQIELDLIMGLRYGIKDLHIGFTNIFVGNQFETAIGTPMNDFQRGLWYKGYPKTGANRNAVLLYQNGQIWDYKNDVKYPFMCELAQNEGY